MNRYHAPYAYDRDDPRNDEPPPYNNHRIGCRCDECRWDSRGGETNSARAELHRDPRKSPDPDCAECGGTGTLSLSHSPYSKGFGHITEVVPCQCRRKR